MIETKTFMQTKVSNTPNINHIQRTTSGSTFLNETTIQPGIIQSTNKLKAILNQNISNNEEIMNHRVERRIS